ncbi:hypothetical protein [Streptomyces sp. NL15-2K]|nr:MULTISPECIES: hypothetical protein [Actinomycetes]WKX06008.1 hypothetical protein Q4V64_00255 [Kutzneria buriramensis]
MIAWQRTDRKKPSGTTGVRATVAAVAATDTLDAEARSCALVRTRTCT